MSSPTRMAILPSRNEPATIAAVAKAVDAALGSHDALIVHADSSDTPATALAVADHPRYWDEGNLTNHLARPLICAATGLDVPQPLAGDLALPATALRRATQAAADLDPPMAALVDGYGIDAFLLLTATGLGPVVSVHLDAPKQHASSFPHLPDIYHQAVPVLLALTAAWPTPPAHTADIPPTYRAEHRDLAPELLARRTTELDRLAPLPDGYDKSDRQ
jgi:glucosylglycerate synthase